MHARRLQHADTYDDQAASPIFRTLLDTLAYARRRDYAGWDYCDGMSSAFLRALPVDNKWLNIAFQEPIKRAPVNVRPYFLVEQRRNFKGTGLFSFANRRVADLQSSFDYEDTVDYAYEAEVLADWLIENRSVGFSGFCGGHKHQIQHLDGRGRPNDPDLVSTTYAVRALLASADLDPEYAAVARTAADFVFEDLDYQEVEGGATVMYYLNHPEDSYTLNAAAVGARMLVNLYDAFGDDELADASRNILDYVVDKQQPEGGWTYRHPPSASHLSMDNHHNGFIVESLLRYHDVTDSDRYADSLDEALTFYRETLFDADGAPNWDESSSYPRDIHAAAQGIIVFARAGDLEFSRRILDWTLDNLYAGDGRFYYRRQRFYTKRITLMRWCQAWMAVAMVEYLDALLQPN